MPREEQKRPRPPVFLQLQRNLQVVPEPEGAGHHEGLGEEVRRVVGWFREVRVAPQGWDGQKHLSWPTNRGVSCPAVAAVAAAE